jgi:hypothetical protein
MTIIPGSRPLRSAGFSATSLVLEERDESRNELDSEELLEVSSFSASEISKDVDILHGQ